MGMADWPPLQCIHQLARRFTLMGKRKRKKKPRRPALYRRLTRHGMGKEKARRIANKKG